MAEHWRWADPGGQQRKIRTDELRAALAAGVIAPNTPVWRPGWPSWVPAHDVPELTTSALSAANGVVPAIPPPPLEVVAVQHAFEAHAKGPESVADFEPPPPPAYVPAPTRAASLVPPAPTSSQRNLGGAPAPSQAITTAVQGSAAEAAPTAPVVAAPKSAPTTLVLPPDAAPGGAPAASPTPPAAGAPVAAAAATPPVPASRPSAPARPPAAAASASKPPPPLPSKAPPAPGPGAPPGSGPSPSKTPPAPPRPVGSVSRPPPPIPSLESEPPDDGPTRVGEVPYASIVAREKSAAPPPPGPPGIKPATMLLYGGVGGTGSIEELSGSVLLSEEPTGAHDVPPAPDTSPGLPDLASTDARPAAPSAATGTLLGIVADATPSSPIGPPDTTPGAPAFPPPAATGFAAPHDDAPTEEGLPPPLEDAPAPRPSFDDTPDFLPKKLSAGDVAAKVVAIVERVGESVRKGARVAAERAGPALEKVRPAAEQALARAKPTFDQAKAKLLEAQAKNKAVLPVLGVLGAMVAILFFAGLVSLVRSCGSDDREADAVDAGGELALEAGARTEPSGSAPAAPAAAAVACTAGTASRVLAPRAAVATGAELSSDDGVLAIGYAATPRDAVVERLDPTSLEASSPLRAHVVEARRILPLAGGSRLAADGDRKTDKVHLRRTMPGGSVDVGFQEDALVWVPHGRNVGSRLFTLPAETPSPDALRGVARRGGYAIVLRQQGSVFLGLAVGETNLLPAGELHRLDTASQIGQPQVGASGDRVAAAWALRDGEGAPWRLKLATVDGDAKPVVRDFPLPPGGPGAQGISPSIVGLGGRRFVLLWSEGPTGGHVVRGQAFDAAGAPSGAAFAVSPEGLDAGQPTGAALESGRGLVAFFAAADKGTDLHVVSLTCPSP